MKAMAAPEGTPGANATRNVLLLLVMIESGQAWRERVSRCPLKSRKYLTLAQPTPSSRAWAFSPARSSVG